ncbi:polymorphic toxin-type HINT domain-containing protein [Nocardioides rubriscoriae]|uniref:polymorphic toxin-type HINT domain-containing protein n=1 Tax=Nocardioides rubriscoriae TaxID=642762 RepID=UPI0011DFD534|nr:polymorphic toxin-type HINT domain-containing protein [Nocardioides rubriscoriae]
MGVRFAYTDFLESFGGDWAQRLIVVAHPACFAVTPEAVGCAESVKVDAVNNTAADTLTFTTTAVPWQDNASESLTPDLGGLSFGAGSSVPASVPTGVSAAATPPPVGTVYSVSAGAGTYAASPLSPASEWQAGNGAGDFTYRVPVSAPTPSVGQAPEVGLDYSSASVDGMTMAENGQASAVGIGWSDVSSGYVTRSYTPCVDDGRNIGDLCWKTDGQGLVNEYTLVLNGVASPLVQVGGAQQGTAVPSLRYRLRDDPGWRVELSVSASPSAAEADNADNNNEAFKVSTPDGTVYWFGFGRAGATSTDSVWTAPVYGNNIGEPCYNATASEAWCQQAWRWNLDRVQDASGNQTRYFYDAEQNYYNRYGSTLNRTSYDRGGALVRIEYGFDSTGQAHQFVGFTQVGRCTSEMGPTPTGGCGTPGNDASKLLWPDVPTDLICSGNAAEVCGVYSPSFFTTRMYKQIVTSTNLQTNAGAVVSTVDRWTLEHTLPDPDGSGPDTADLWLSKVTHTGVDGAVILSDPPITFDGTARPSRVNVTEAGGREYNKLRLASIRNETGGRIDVGYGHASSATTCSPSYVTGRSRDSSTRECWAELWTPPAGGPQRWEWFHKYVVIVVAVADDSLGYRFNTPTTTATVLGSLRYYDYEYTGAPAWRYVDNRNAYSNTADDTKDKTTWSDWRGYEKVSIHTRNINATNNGPATGDTALRTVSVYRGMTGTRKTIAGALYTADETRLNLQQFQGQTQPSDNKFFGGVTAEESTLTGTGALIERTFHDWAAFTTAQEGKRLARTRYEAASITTTAVAGAADRTRKMIYEVQRSEDPTTEPDILAGTVKSVSDLGDPATASDDRCTTNTWAKAVPAPDPAPGSGPPPSAPYLRVLTATTLHAASCGTTAALTGANLVRRTRTVYDATGPNQTQGTITRGLPTQVTRTATVTTATTAGPDDTALVTRTQYDTYGRTTAVFNARGNKTSIDYQTPSGPTNLTGNIVTRTVVTDAQGNINTTVTEPRRQQPVSVTDANDNTTQVTYDPLGRLTTVTYPGNPTSTPNMRVEYALSTQSPTRVKTTMLREDDGTTDVTAVFYDGWGRAVESQVAQPENPTTARVVTVTGYDNQGLARYQMPVVPATGNLTNPTVVNPRPADVARYTITSYDAAQRPTSIGEYTNTTLRATTRTAYPGDRTVMTPAVGGDTVTRTDVQGRPTSVALYEARETNPANTNGALDAVTYTHDAADQLTTLTKTVDNTLRTWRWGYDLTGRQLFSDDPDTGATLTRYDPDDNPTTETRAAGLNPEGGTGVRPWQVTARDVDSSFTTTYDTLDRPTVRVDNTNTSQPFDQTRWYYDDRTNGRLRLSQVDQRIIGITDPAHPDLDTTTASLPEVPTVRVPGQSTPVPDATVLTATTDAYWSTYVTAYDERGNPLGSGDAYPAWLAGVTIPAGATQSGPVTDLKNRLTYTDTQTYNQANQTRTTTYPEGGQQGAMKVTTTYKTGGLLDTMSTVASPSVIGEVTGPASGTLITIAKATYNNIGELNTLTSSIGTETTLNRQYSFEAATGRISALSSGQINPLSANATGTTGGTLPSSAYLGLTLGYTYDLVGNPTKILGSAGRPGLAGTTTGATTVNGAWCYAYDGLQRLKTARTAQTISGSCAATGDTTDSTQLTGAPYQLTYGYTDDRLTTVTQTGGPTATYTYNETITGTGATGGLIGTDTVGATGPHQATSITLTGTPAITNPVGTGLPPLAGLSYDNQGRITQALPVPLTLADNPTALPAGTPTTGAASRTSTYQYDHSGNPTLITTADASLTNPTQLLARTEAAYSPDGIRIAQRSTDTAGGLTTTIYRSDGTEQTCTATCTPDGLTGPRTTRYLNAPTGPVATRTSDGWSWHLADNQQSIRLTRDPTGTTTRTNYTPHGQPTPTLNTPPTPNPITAPGNRGYLNKPHDPTGDLRLDHRNITSTFSLFTTPDPVLVTTDPLSSNPYAYARNNPIANSDPTGLVCGHGSDSYCAQNYTPVVQVGAGRSNEGSASLPPLTDDQQREIFFAGVAPPGACETADCVYDRVQDQNCNDSICLLQLQRYSMNLPVIPVPNHELSIDEVALLAAYAIGMSDLGVRIPAAETESLVANAAKNCLNSFTADTPVAMADGSAKPISQVKVGDRVMATDPETGETKAEPVVQLIRHSGQHQMVQISLTDGSVLDSTGGHPIWDDTTSQFTVASKLRVGDKIMTAGGRLIAIARLRRYVSDLTAYNLQITHIHTYYAGNTPVLVHNSCGYTPAGGFAESDIDEVAQAIYQHIGGGELPGRPGFAQIQEALTRGTPEAVKQGDGSIAQMINYRGLRVYINEDRPWRSTAFYPGVD